MEEPLSPQELADLLQHELARASELGARGLHVQITVPATSAYRWSDDDGHEHAVYLPTQLKSTPLRFPGEPREDGGPAAVFRINAGGQVPPETVTNQMSDELYRECVRWGRVHHVEWGAAPGAELPELPDGYEEIVQTAMYMDVS